MSDLLKDKIIIVAMEGEGMNQQIRDILKEKGYQNLLTATDGAQVYTLLRQYSQQLEQIGLVLIEESLPHCQVGDLCKTFAYSDAGYLVPFLIVTLPHSTFALDFDQEPPEQSCLVKNIEQPIAKSELITDVTRYAG